VGPLGNGAPFAEGERWSVGDDYADLTFENRLSVHIDWANGTATVAVSTAFLRSEPSFVARLGLETPVATLLAWRGYAVVHAGAVVGAAGAVVLRGPSGAGKSTLVAAAHRAGLEVLGDETILVAREDPDELVAAVRDPLLSPEMYEALGYNGAGSAGSGEKRRLDLFASSTPHKRKARRRAVVLLGPFEGQAARLEALSPERFLDEFKRGAIPQERWGGTPPTIAEHWSRRAAYRLFGARDLHGAVRLLSDLCANPDSGDSQ